MKTMNFKFLIETLKNIEKTKDTLEKVIYYYYIKQ